MPAEVPDDPFKSIKKFRGAEAHRRLSRYAAPLGQVGLEAVIGTFLAAQYRAKREPLLREVFDYSALPRNDILVTPLPLAKVDGALERANTLLMSDDGSTETDSRGRLQARRILASMTHERAGLVDDIPEGQRDDTSIRCDIAGLIDRAIISRLQGGRVMNDNDMTMFEMRSMRAGIEPLTDALRLAVLMPEDV